MITTKHGSIFDSTAEVIVVPVNCVGVMGAGLALEAKKRWPKESAEYVLACQSKSVGPGGVMKVGRLVFAATKVHWQFTSCLHYVETCLENIAGWLHGDITWGVNSIALPQLGCGCGRLDWADVEPLVHKHLSGLDCDVEVWIYE